MNLWESITSLKSQDGAEIMTLDVVTKNVRESESHSAVGELANQGTLHAFQVAACLLAAEPSDINHVCHPLLPGEDVVGCDIEKPEPFFTGEEVWRANTEIYEQTILAYRFENGKVVVISIERGTWDTWDYLWVP